MALNLTQAQLAALPPDVRAEMERLAGVNEALAAKVAGKVRAISIKVGDKGGVVVSGLQRFPTTLYANDWVRLLDHAAEIKAFIVANASKLSSKD